MQPGRKELKIQLYTRKIFRNHKTIVGRPNWNWTKLWYLRTDTWKIPSPSVKIITCGGGASENICEGTTREASSLGVDGLVPSKCNWRQLRYYTWTDPCYRVR